MPYEKILYALVGQVAIIRLNDPDTLNAMSGPMGSEILDAIHRAQGEARALMITGEGRAFCSGANLAGGFFDLEDPERDAGRDLEAVFNPMILALRHSAIPVVTAVRGAAAGVGCGIACAGDLIVAGEGAYFYQAFRHVGLSPDGGSTYLLAKAIGRVRAMEMMLLGAKLPAAKALEWGLINRVVPDDQIESTALAFATELAAGPRSLGFIRDAAWSALDAHLSEQLLMERRMQCASGRTTDFLEGVAAFQDRRPPRFTGR